MNLLSKLSKEIVYEELQIPLSFPQLILYEKNVKDKCRYDIDHHDWYVFLSEQVLLNQEIIYDPSEIENFEWMSRKEIVSNKDKFTEGSFFILDKMEFFNE